MYGIDDLSRYATGMARNTGVAVRVHQGPPSTDGSTVWLDGGGILSRADFHAACGTANHEIAHVWFKDNTTTKGWAASMCAAAGVGAEYEGHAHSVVNVVLDIAGETRMEAFLPGTRDGFYASNARAMARIWAKLPKNNKGAAFWIDRGDRANNALTVGILSTRIPATKVNHPNPRARHMEAGIKRYLEWGVKQDGLYGVLGLLKKAKDKTRPALKPGRIHNPARTARNWADLHTLCVDLFKILLPFFPPPQPGQGQGQGEGEGDGLGQADPVLDDGNGPGQGPGQIGSDSGHAPNMMDDARRECAQEVASQEHQDDLASQGDCAGDQADAAAGTGPVHKPGTVGSPVDQADAKDRVEAESAKAIGRGPGCNSAEHFTDHNFYVRVKAGIDAHAAELMETDDAMRRVGRSDNGDRLNGRWTSLYTDGQVWRKNERTRNIEAAVALCVDVSGSMNGCIGKASATCKAFADLCDDLGVEVAAWRFDDRAYRVRIAELGKMIANGGGTSGAPVARAATDWLLTKPEARKLCIIITDGGIGDTASVTAIMRAGAQRGVDYLLIGVEMTRYTLERYWAKGTRAAIIDMRNPGGLGVQLAAEAAKLMN